MKKYLFTIGIVFSAFLISAQTANYWVKKSDTLQMKRSRAVAFTVGNYGYVGTGIDTNEVVLRDFWRYDQATDSWSQVASLPGTASERRDAVAFTIGDYGYVGTGINKPGSQDPGATRLRDLWRYDPTSNTWSQMADYPGNFQGVYFATGFAIGTNGYVACGKIGPNNYLSTMWRYNSSVNTWQQVANFPGGDRYQLSSFVIEDKAYVGLGTDHDIYRKDIWEYKESTGQWSQRADLPGGERSTAATFTIGQRGYVCMGTNGGYLDDLWEFNPITNTWMVRADYGGSPRKGAVGFSLNGLGYVGTGKGYSGKKKSFHEYHPGVTGLEEYNVELKTYPNPAVDYIQIDSKSEYIKEFQLYSSMGRRIMTINTTDNIDVSHLSSGVYLIAAIGNDNKILAQHKFIKQ